MFFNGKFDSICNDFSCLKYLIFVWCETKVFARGKHTPHNEENINDRSLESYRLRGNANDVTNKIKILVPIL